MARTSMLALGLLSILGACATAELKPSTAWVAENPGWATEAKAVYADAASFITEKSKTLEAGQWAVVLDLDETVLNNVAYQERLDRLGESYSKESWFAWTQEKRAGPVPGAMAFIDHVNTLGGHVAFVTNRSDTEQFATEWNLDALGIKRGEDFRVLLTRARPNGARDKNARFALVAPLLAAQGYPDVEIIAYVGDNVGDQPTTLGAAQFFCIDQGAMYGEPCAAVPGPGQ